ncbi:unnamed protein product [Periconia digitata]|uniref:Uncharacterized protein n=1 Tax=Periconia digitata TaxID=1303443 RepID=A0A9W4U113_9PLEO|nr:unnamed protein product [Periconia digitata]
MDPVQLRGSGEDDIHLGFWSNKSMGKVAGATLTVNRQTGSIFIAMLALYVTATGRSFWRICRYFLHLYLSRDTDVDGIYHQRQSSLRNIELALDTMLELLFANHAWRHRAKKVSLRILPVATFAAVIYIAFVAAGIFSSRAIDRSILEGNDVLVSGRDCGIIKPNTVSYSQDYGYRWDPQHVMAMAQNSLESITLASTCYRRENASSLRECRAFTQVRLPYNIDRATRCPFDSKVCKSNTSNLEFDTGKLDSLDHLGLNAGPRFQFRHQAACGPLKTDGYSERYNDSAGGPAQLIGYKYATSKANSSLGSYLYSIPEFRSSTDVAHGNYLTTPIQSPYFQKDFDIIPELETPSSLLSLVFLEKSTIVNLEESTDPWLGAAKQVRVSNITGYSSEEPVGVMGCVTTRTFCLPDSEDRCMLWNVADAETQLSKLWPEEKDRAILRPLFSLLTFGDAGSLDFFYTDQGSLSLLARNTLSGALQGAKIAEDWWQHELEHVFQASLAATQRVVLAYARGEPWTRSVASTAYGRNEVLCKSQKIRSPQHYSFSILDIVVIFIIGAIFIVLSTFLDRLVDVAPKLIPHLRRSRKFMYARAEWQTGSTLQIQRMAHESLGLGTWSRTTESVPVTEFGDQIGVLDISDEKHPRLMRKWGRGDRVGVEDERDRLEKD